MKPHAAPTAHTVPLTTTQTWWLLATGIAAYLPLIAQAQAPLWLAGVAAAAFAWRAALAVWRQPLPTRWVLSFIALAGAAGVFLEYRTLFGQRAGVALLLIFMALKQLEARAPRDGLAIVLLAYFLTLTQFFEDQSIPIAATLFATVLVATATLASLTDARPSPIAQLRHAGLMLAQALPLMLILFVLFPRVSGPLWGLPTDAYSGLTGLSDSMSPGSLNNLIQSDAIAFRVKFDGPPPPRQQLYWRGPVLSRLEGRTWRPDVTSAVQAARPLPDPPYFPTADSAAYRYTVTLEAHNKPWLFALELPDAVPAIAEGAFITPEYQLHARKPLRERRRYTLQSHPDNTPVEENPSLINRARNLPAGLNPRTRALAESWTSAHPADSARQHVDRAIAFLRAQRLTYTLQPPLMSDHVADEFLFDHRRGFCEHFAASFVVLLRAAGVPARVVTGYQGGERNPVDDTWVIRQSDAHAWAEVWLGNADGQAPHDAPGWVRIDPTATSAPARVDQNLAAAVPAGEPLPLLARAGLDWLKELRFRWWAVNNAWNQWVLGFDPQRQRDLLEKLGMDAPDWRKMTATLAIASGLALLGLIGALLWRRPHLDPAERQWRRATKRLARRGLPRQPWEGPLDYAQRIAAALPATAPEFTRIATLYAGLRYGQMSASQLAELRRRVAEFTAAKS